MQVDIISEGAFCSALVKISPDETLVSESGAMFRASGNIDIDVTTKSRGKGGILRAAKRLLGGESFFFSTYRTTDGAGGEIGLAPTLPGEVRTIQLDRSSEWILAGGSYLGSGEEVEIDPQFQGFKGLFTGESLFFMVARGEGPLILSAFGRIEEREVDGNWTVDTSHLVAYESSLQYRVGKIANSWRQSFFSGEGLAMHFEGRGRVLVQSHAAQEFGQRLGPMLPERKN